MPSKTLPNEWKQALAYDIALHLENVGEPIPELIKKYAITLQDFQTFLSDPHIKRTVQTLRDQIKEKNIPFKLKARIACDYWLAEMDKLILDATANPTAKVALFQHMTKLAGYEPPKTAEAPASATHVEINFNLRGPSAQDVRSDVRVIEHDPTSLR